MKTEKNFLSSAAAVATLFAAFSFRMHPKFATQLFTSTSGCNHASPACFTLPTGDANPHPCSSAVTYYLTSTCATPWNGLKTLNN